MTDYTPEALEALSKAATQGPEEYAAFVNALFDAYRTGQLVHAVPSDTLSPDAIRDCLVTTVLATPAQPSGDEVEAVARKLAPFMEGGREYDQMPATRRELKIWSRNGMALINDATQDDAQEAAIAAITAYEAVSGVAKMREALRPFANVTILPDGPVVGLERHWFTDARAALGEKP